MNIEQVDKCKDRLMASLKEEFADVEKYADIYQALKERGHYDEADVIEEIARDEFTHAEALYDILEDWGYDLSQNPEITNMWHKVKEIFHIK
jgi:bacterioferritin (cytochrome b1)